MGADPGVHLVCLGDFNGRMKALEPKIESDQNGKIIENWINIQGMHHLNQTENCIGKYTYGRPGKPWSAIDHILINNIKEQTYKVMEIDENLEQL